jgi:hypothetical protein
MVHTEGLFIFAKVHINDKLVALVAIPEVQGKDLDYNWQAGYFHGLMDQAMEYNPVLQLMDAWEFLETGWTPLQVCSHTVIVL